MQNKKNEKPLGETWQGLYNPFAPRAIEKDNDIVTPLLPVEDVEKPEVVEENPDPELLERMRLSSELREMSTGSGLSQIRADLRERGINPLSTSSVQGEVHKASRMRSALNGIGIYADDEGYYDVSAIPQQYLSHYNDMETTGSVDVVRDAEGNIQRVRFGNSDIVPYIDNSITNTTFPTQLSRKAQSDYFRELTTNVISQLPTDENGNITYMGVPYQWSELYSALYPIVAQTAHDESLASNPNYFRWHFQETMGQSYDDWYKEWAAGRIDEIESRIKTLRDEVGAEGRAEGETIGNTEMRGRTSLLPASVRAWMMGALTEDVATKPFDDALEAIKTYRENSFDAGFDEALDLLDVVSFGMMELSTATEQTSILEKARRGEELTKSEQAMLELMQIQQEFEGIKSQLGWEQHWLSKTGSGIGSTVSAAIPFGVGMITTGGVGSMTSLGAGVARNMGVKAAVKQVGKNIVKNTATAYARGAIVAPIMPSTWSAYAQDYKSQYSFNPDGSVAFKPKDKGLMYLGAYIDGMNEFAWEAGGAMLGEIIGHGARFFGRAMRLNNIVDNVLGRVDNTVYGPAVRKAMTWQKSPELREVQRLAGFQGGYLAEASSEVAGDFMSQVMRATVGAESDFEQFKDKDYWITQGLVSVLYGGALNTPHYISNVGEFAKIVGLGKQSQRLIDGVENAELRNRLLSITADGNIDRASSELATIDWSKYHATDKARALDYVRTNYTLQTLSSSVTEDTRTRSYLRDVSAMSDNIYHGGTVEENGTIMRGVANDGRSYYVVDGKPNDKSEASMLTCVDAETGARKAILASNFEVQTIAGYQETIEQMYNERFSASIEAERLASLQSAYEQMDNPTNEDVASIMEQYHIEAPQIGDNVTLADGRTAEVLNNHGDGTYLMQMNEGTSAIVTVPFYSIQSKDALTASAQRFMIEGRAERATEKAVDIAEGAVAEGTVPEEQGMSPIQNVDAENIPTEESLAEAVQTEQAVEEQGANVVLDMESVPRTEDGSVDYDSIDSPKMFARVYETEAGSREQAMADVVEMRDATAAELEASEGKSKGLINPMKKIAARKEREALRQRIALYDGVIRELEGMDAEYSSIYRNQYSEQIAEPTKAVLNDMAKALGLKVRFVESVDEGRANAKIEDGVVEIAFLNRDSSIAFLMGHEFTHQMQDLGGEAYAKFQNMIRGFVGQETWDAKKNALRAAYEAHGKTITDKALDDELTADVAGELVEKKGVFIDYLRKSKTDTGILTKLSNWLKKMAGLFRNKGAKEYADSVNDLAMQLDNLIAEATANATKGDNPALRDAKYAIKGNKGLQNLHKASDTIRKWVENDTRGKSFTIELPMSVNRQIRREMGRDFDSHNITANGIAHALKNHGVGGLKLTDNSIPIRKEDAELIPYIMVAPDKVSKASTDVSGRESVRFYKKLENGYVVVVEKEYKNSPDDMETITMWAEMSPQATNAQSKTAPDTHVLNAILSTDIAKIVKDAENAIIKEEKFSLRGSDKSLVGIHNLSLDKLRKVIKMGGLANPSVAVIDVDKQTHDDYGEYSLILPNNMVDARKGKNAGTWAGDAWTPTYPQVVKRMTDDKAISRFYKDIDALPDAMRSRVKLDFDSFMEGRSANALAYWYLFEEGDAPELVYVPSRYSDDITNAIEEATNGSFSMYRLTPEERAKCLDAYIAVKFDGDRAAFETEMQERVERLAETIDTKKSDRVKKWAQDTIDSINEYGFDYDDVAKFIRDVEYDAREKGTVNVDATITAARELVEANNLEADYDAWRNNLDERYGIEEYIFDGYTNNGNRRYLPHTVENASKWMKKQGRQGAVATFPSFGTFVAVSIPKMTTLESIRKRKALLGKSKEEYDAFQEKWENVYYELGKKLQPDAKSYDDYGYWRLIEAVGHKNPKEFVKKEYNIELSEEDMAQLNDMLNAIRTEYPARYFETKFERPLQLSDFVAAVVPNDMPLDVYGRLKDANVEIFEYDKNVEGSRQEVLLNATDNPDVRFSLRTNGTSVFYSNAQKAVLDIKQEKATPEQWLKMIEKNGGLKAGEDKWLGLSDWLKASDKKTLTKDEVLQYIAENDIQIEEVEYGDIEDNPRFKELEKEYQSHYSETYDTIISFERMVEKYGEDFELAFEASGMNLYPRNEYGSEDAQRYLGINEINSTRRQYTTDGLTNKREIALTVPTIESWNTNDDIHFGDAGEGRAVAWIRFGETPDTDGKRVLVIDEIQSKRHQEGREKGYNNPRVIEIFTRLAEIESNLYSQGISMEMQTEREALKAELESIFEKENPVMKSLAEQIDEKKSKRTELIKEKMNEDEERAEIYRLREKQNQVRNNRDYDYYEAEISEIEDRIEQRHEDIDLLNSNILDLQLEYSRLYNKEVSNARVGVSPAPFEKNWAELAMKRMLRYAVENGYDYVAWTTGDQQNERYGLSKVVDNIHTDFRDGDNGSIRIEFKDGGDHHIGVDRATGNITFYNENHTAIGKPLADVIGQELADKILTTKTTMATISGVDLDVTGKGMASFYDQMLPSFVKKYTKKWDAEVKDITMPELEENNTMHAVNVTDSMRESVMQGQPKFSLRDVEAQRFNRKVEFVKGLVRDFNIPNPLFIAETKEEFVRLVKDYDGDVDEFTSEAYGYYCPSDDIILLNGGMFITSGNAHRSTMHEYAHSITRKYLGAKLAEVTASIPETEISKAQKEVLPEAYNDYSYPEIIDEFTSLLLEDLTIAETRAIFEGEMAIDTFVEKLKKDIKAIEKISNKDVLYAVIPLVVENLKIQKEQYGKDREHTIVIPRVDSRRNPTFSKTSHLSGDKKSRSIEAESRIYETGRGGEGSQEEVTPRLSIRTDTAIAEEEYKQNLLESAQQMEREGHDAQAIADRTGWVHLADGNWKYYGEGKLAITNEASAQRAAYLWLESKKAIKKAQVATTYDPIIREQKKAVAEIEKNQKDEYKKQRRNVDKVEYILQGQPVESLPIEDQVLVDIALGQRIKWSDGDGKHGLKSELGLQSAKSEGMGAVTLAAKDYVEDYVERLMERNNGYEKSLDDNDIRNAVLEVFRGYPSPKAAIDELYARYKPQADLTQAEDALAKLEYERDSALVAIDAEYREIFDDFDTNPDRYVREHQESESYNANLDMYVGSLGKARADVARLERETTKRKLSDEEKASAMRAVKAAIAKELRDGLGRYTRKYDIQRMMDAVNDARTPYAMLKAIDKAMESLFEIKWRREYARMESLTKMKLTYGVTTTDPTTFLNTLVADHKVTASDARKIMNDYWRGVNASGVAVAKYIDDNTRQIFKFVQKYVDFKNAQVALNKEGAFARNLARELRSQIESNSIANDEIRAMLAVPEVRAMAYEATDILERYWTAQSEQLGVANDKDKREISALGIKVKEITARIADINAQIKETTNKKVVVYKGEAIDADLARKRLTEEYNSLIAERMEAYEKMYSVMPNIIKSMQDANNALENLLRTGRVQLAKERAERMEAERQLVNDAIRDMGAENAVNILDRSIQDTRDIRRGAWYKAKGLAGDTLGAALGSMEYMLRKMGVNAPMGEGRMFDHFAPALQRAYDNIFTSTRECKQILDDKSKELWGKTYPEIHKLAENTKIGATYDNRDIYVTQALYFLAMWDQADARKAMEEKQGFSAEKIDAIRNALNNLDPRWLEFSDWIIHDFMPSRRDRYNEVHKKLFGTSMAHVSNYFPIKRAKEAIHNDVDVSTPDTNLLPSTVVGAIKERTSNIVPIDVETSFFEALNDNVATMESWVEMSPIIEDFNALLSSTTVREMMADISPSMHNDFKEAAKVATLEYVGKIPDIDKNWGTILNRLWAGTKIAFRLFTAFKQLSSALLFAGYSGSPEFQARLLWRYISGVGLMPLKVMQGVINGTSTLTGDSFKKIDIMGNIDWAKSTLPSFARRWEEGFAGNEVMKRTLGNKSWKNRTWVTAMDEAITAVNRFGFKANAFIDAFTVAAGARAVYDFEVNRLQKEGYSAEKAHTIAVMKAEMMYNSTQQSSEGLYLAPMQKDRSILATSLSTFMNAPFAMSRNMVVGFNELMRNAKAERKDVEHRIYTRMMKAYRESIENTIISEIDSGKLGDEDAIKARRDELTAAAIIEAQSAAIPMAKAKVKDTKIKAALAIVLNGYGGQLYFNLMSQLPALIFGDDDEEKKQILLDLALHSLWEAPLSIIPVINILPAAINGYSANIFPAVNELIESVVEIVDSIKESGVDMEVVKLTAGFGMRWGFGLEIDTWKNIYLSLESMIEDGVSPEAILKFMNGPEKQIRNIVGQRREDESEKEYVERVMRFYAIFNDPKLEDYFDTDMYVRNAYGAPTKYRSLTSRYNGDTPFGMTKSQMQRIKYEEAYRRNVVLRYGGSAALHDYENTEAQYKDLRNEGVDDFKYGQQQVLQRMASNVNAKAAALSRRVGKDDPRYYELLLDLQELQQKYIDKYEQFK